MYLLRQSNLGGYAPGNYLKSVNIGLCLCGESYYRGSDGVRRIVSSGQTTLNGQKIEVWLEPSFKLESASPNVNGTAGFFTSVSSNGTQNAIIWAVDRPANNTPGEVRLYAYDPATASMVFSATAGTWPNTTGHSNIVPVVASGRVYVASYQQLTIWGLTAPPAVVKLAHPVFENPVKLEPGDHDVFGTITAMSGTTITLKKRDGTTTSVNTADAPAPPLTIGQAVRMVGTGTGTALHAKWIARAPEQSKGWPPDK
jgi:hypothetical protein